MVGRHAIAIFALTLAGIASGCGEKRTPPALPVYGYDGIGQYLGDSGEIRFGNNLPIPKFNTEVPSITDAERKEYCGIFTPQETNLATRQTFLEQLSAAWRMHDPQFVKPNTLVTYSDGKSEKKFEETAELFEFNLLQLRGTQSNSFIRDDQIEIQRICLSRPIENESQFSGYRILEMVASGNESVVAMAIKFESPAFGHPYPTLFKTRYKWIHRGYQLPLSAESLVFAASPSSDETSIRVQV